MASPRKNPDARSRTSKAKTDPSKNGVAPARRVRHLKDASGLTYRVGRIQDARPFRFAWAERILLGYLNLLVGVEGIGKGNLVAWTLARVTRGDLPGDLHGTPHNVAIIGDEDSFDNVWIPRIVAAGGDERRVRFIESGTDGVVDVNKDAMAIKEFAENQDVVLFYFDQLLDNLGYADSWKDKQIRNALAPLKTAIQDLDIAALMTMHPNKRGGSFRDRISGTPAFNALSRSSLFVVNHPHEPGRRVAVRAKGNYNVEPQAFEFLIEEHSLDNKARGAARHIITTSRICEMRETSLKADDILATQPSRLREDSKAGQARALLTRLLADGEPRSAKELQDELLAEYGLAERVVNAAANKIGVRKWVEGFPARSYWQLPKDGAGPRRGTRVNSSATGRRK